MLTKQTIFDLRYSFRLFTNKSSHLKNLSILRKIDENTKNMQFTVLTFKFTNIIELKILLKLFSYF